MCNYKDRKNVNVSYKTTNTLKKYAVNIFIQINR